ncbi:MAG: peptide-methionine (S)-S-oxide reductase MsrA [Chroococcidiopsidaceae cyanobacterium CP_BM_RX_35]|nr:peptide-methionine (S)-S-oxide reductase MsrA [Chroococcidiopsidaceae cyanobacterium CP_BM_RX_35]
MSICSFALSRRSVLSLSIISLTAVVLVNGVSRMTLPAPAADNSTAMVKGRQMAVLSGGCFWGMEAVFEHLKGVSAVVSGFSGGSAATANYEVVSSGKTGHAESVKITYDPSQISYSQLLKIYFLVAHDPTQLNRQGPDWGTQYRSVIFFANDEQKRVAQAYIDQLNKAHFFHKPIVTQLVRLNGFYPAEAYHQHFIDRNPNYPYVVVNDWPKLTQLREQFPDLYKQ